MTEQLVQHLTPIPNCSGDTLSIPDLFLTYKPAYSVILSSVGHQPWTHICILLNCTDSSSGSSKAEVPLIFCFCQLGDMELFCWFCARDPSVGTWAHSSNYFLLYRDTNSTFFLLIKTFKRQNFFLTWPVVILHERVMAHNLSIFWNLQALYFCSD